jgi:hypothetical protein
MNKKQASKKLKPIWLAPLFVISHPEGISYIIRSMEITIIQLNLSKLQNQMLRKLVPL